MPPNPNTPPEAPKLDEGELARKKTVEKVHSSLEALRQNIKKPEEEKKTHLANLQRSLEAARTQHVGDNSDKWKTFERKLEGELQARDIAGLEKALKEDKEVALDLGHLADEMGATEEYLEIQQDQAGKIYNRVNDAISKKFGSSKLMTKLKEWGISVEDIRNWIVNLIAGILEGFPIGAMSKVSGGLRFRAALDDAKKDKLLTAEDKKLVEDPKKEFRHEDGTTHTLEDLWMTRYEEWLTRKRAASGAFKEAPPSIRSVLHPPKGPSITQAPADKLFDVDGLKQGGAPVEIASRVPRTIQVNADRIVIERRGDTAEITINGTRPFKVNHAFASLTLQAPSQNAGEVILSIKTKANDVVSASLAAIIAKAAGDTDFEVVSGGKKMNFQKIS